MKRIIVAAAMCLLAAGCAKAPSSIAAANVSVTGYQAWSCDQLANENAKISTSLDSLSATQSQAATGDAMGVFLVGLPVASMTGGDREGEIARIKGEKAAIYQVQISKKCLR